MPALAAGFFRVPTERGRWRLRGRCKRRQGERREIARARKRAGRPEGREADRGAQAAKGPVAPDRRRGGGAARHGTSQSASGPAGVVSGDGGGADARGNSTAGRAIFTPPRIREESAARIQPGGWAWVRVARLARQNPATRRGRGWLQGPWFRPGSLSHWVIPVSAAAPRNPARANHFSRPAGHFPGPRAPGIPGISRHSPTPHFPRPTGRHLPSSRVGSSRNARGLWDQIQMFFAGGRGRGLGCTEAGLFRERRVR